MTAHALFAVAPYVAAAVFATLAAWRLAALVREQRRPHVTDADSALQRGNRLWRVGLAGTLAGHAAILFLTQPMLRWTASLPRLIAFEVAAVLFGLAAAAGLLALLGAHLKQGGLRAPRMVGDAFVLGLLATTITSGLFMAVTHRWAISWSLVTVAPYVRSVLALGPEVHLVDALPYLLRVHVLSALAAVAVLPLSHALDPPLRPLSRLLAGALAAAAAAAHWARARVEDAARRAAQALWWREEEE
jgi:nitrate reductase gamma subunit